MGANLSPAGYPAGYPARGPAINRWVSGRRQGGRVPSSPPIECVLQTGAVETPYHRAGAGAPVILLFADGLADPVASRLFSSLSEHFRVIAPAVPDGVPFAPWLRDLIDGLGLDRPGLISEEPLAASSLQFSLDDPDRVAGAVAVRRHGERAARPVEVGGDLDAAVAQIVALLSAA